MVEVTHDKLVKTYVKIRDARHVLKSEYERQDHQLKQQLETLEVFMLGLMNTSGIDSFRTSAGTVYKQETIIPQASDWSAFYKWVRETNGFDFLFKRIKADAIKDYMEQHDGEVPPGVSIYGKFEVRVRRK
jgi:hypothetical protein